MPSFTSPRISLFYLRALIREAAKGLDDLDPDQGMALMVDDQGNTRYYVLYRAGFMVKSLAAWEEEARLKAKQNLEKLRSSYKKRFPFDETAAREQWIENAVSDYMFTATSPWVGDASSQIRDGSFPIVAMMKVFTGRSKKYPQWGASTVETSAANPGWGPFMYDIVMSQEGGLTPDRTSVSGAARGVWEKYKTSRPDVEAKPLDDPERPRTKTKQDDTSQFHGDDAPFGELPTNPLNYAYFLESGAPDVSSLISQHRQAAPILEKYRINIADMAGEFFYNKYHRGI